MALDQDIQYKVRIDDSDFQAKLSQMRASVDTMMGSSMGGMSGGGMSPMGGMGMSQMGGMMSIMNQPGSSAYGGGFADFGLGVRPITYTPPAIAMQPHFGMMQIQQSLGQAVRGSIAPYSFGKVPEGISAEEYAAYSTRQVGNAAGNFAMSATQTAMSFGMGMLGGEIGAAMGSSFGPVGTVVGGIAGSMAATAYSTTPAGERTVQNVGMQNALAAGSFRFISEGKDLDPITGRGFSRAARAEAATSIQHMEMNDLRYGPAEMKQVLESGMQQDMFTGSQDVEGFKTKFKNLVDTMKTITSTLHTSIGEGMEAMRGMRDMGVDSPQGMKQLALGSELAGRMSGRTGMEMMAIGQTGAEMFRGTGVSMELGFKSMQQNMVSVRSLLNEGLISRETVGQAGGEQGLAQQLTAQGLASTQTGFGRAFMMANYDPITHGLAAGAEANLGSFNINQAAAKLSGMTPGGLISFQVHQREMVSKMSPQTLQSMSIGMTASGARQLSAATGVNAEDAYRFVGENVEHKSHEVIETELAMIKQDPEKRHAAAEAQINGMVRGAALEADRNRFNIGKRISNAFTRAVSQPISDFVTGIGTSAATAAEHAMQSTQSWLLGGGFTSRTDATAASATRGEAVLKREAAAGVASGPGTVTDATHAFTYTELSKKIREGGTEVDKDKIDKEKLAAGVTREIQYNGVKVEEFSSEKQANDYLQKHGGGTIVDRRYDSKSGAPQIRVMTDKDLVASQKNAYAHETTQEDRDKATKTINSMSPKILGHVENLKKDASADDIAKAVYGPNADFNDMKGEARAVIENLVTDKGRGFTAAAKKLEAEKRDSGDAAHQRLSTLADNRNTAEKEARAIISEKSGDNLFTRVTGIGATGKNMSGDDISAAAAYAAATADDKADKGAAAVEFRRHASKDTDVDTVLKAINNMDKGEKEKFAKKGETIDKGAAAMNELSGGASTGQAGSGPIAGVSKDDMQAMSTIATQILESMKQVDAIHQQIMARQAGR